MTLNGDSETAGKKLQELEGWLARLLWARLAALGWLKGDKVVLGIGAERYVHWSEAALRLARKRGLDSEGQAPEWESEWARWENYRQWAGGDKVLGAQVRLADATLKALPEILSGERAATEVLFPQGNLSLVEGIYRDQPLAVHFNELLAEQLAAYVQGRLAQNEQTKLSILEIGAGTGATTRKLLERLATYEQQIGQYCYTDVSAAFLLPAEE
jgi:polyketide synthase PksL